MTNPLHDLAMIRKIAFYCAIVTLIVACLMSMKFGWSMSPLHALSLGLVTICTAVIFPYIGHQWRGGSKWYAGALIPIAAVLCLVEFGTHSGYTNGVRTIETEGATVQNAAYDLTQETAKRNAANLEGLRNDLSKLREAHPWAISVSADGLRAQLAPMEEAIRQEERRGGCGPKCLALQKDKAALEERMAIAAEAGRIGTQIALLETVVNEKAEAAVKADYRSSEVVAQTNIFAKAVAWSLEPTAAQRESTQIGVGFAMSLATTFLPAIFMLMAFGPAEFIPGHKSRVAEATQSATDEGARLLREMHALMSRAPVAPVSAPANHTHEKEVVVLKEDDPRAKALYGVMEAFANKARVLRAA